MKNNNDIWNLNWNWTEFCPTGVAPFAGNSNDLLPCFQEIILQVPIYTVFAALSAYNFGSYSRAVSRNALQRRLIFARIAVSLLLALLPVWKIFTFHHKSVTLYPIDVLLVCTVCVMWIVHCGYLLSAQYCGELSHRGPVCMNVIWLLVFVLDAIWLRTSWSFVYWYWSLTTVILDLFYGLTLFPSGNASIASQHFSGNIDQDSLLSTHYTQFFFDLDEVVLGHAQDEANFVSRFVFHWVEPLITKGIAGHLRKIEDLFDLPESLNITRLADRLQMYISQTRSLFRALHKSFGLEFYLIGLLRFVADIAGFAGPLLLGGLLSHDTTEDGLQPDKKPFFYALGLFGATLLTAFGSSHFNWRMSMLGMKMRIGLVNTIYRKALEANGLKDARPEILNLMSTDTDRIVNSCISFHSFWSIPFQLFTTLYLLYVQLGAAFIAGVLLAVALIPINRLLAKKIRFYSEGLMSSKDVRLAATSEIMNGAKQIKLYAWEDVFIAKIRALRTKEIKFLSKRKYLDALCVYFWATTPVLMCFLTFGFSALLGNPLVAATTYTSVALLNMLIAPLNAFPWVLNGLIEAWVSVNRVQELLNLPNLDLSSYYNPIMGTASSASLITDSKPIVIQLKEASFVHESSSDYNAYRAEQPLFRLENIDLEIKKGELVCIEGPVGGGKSSLISALIGGIQSVDGCICVHDITTGFGFVSQSAWLQRGTIRDNIVWGAVFDEQRYKKVLYACALIDDLEKLGGDLVGVGENGHTLSGGQRARIAVARAVYQDKKVYVMDDILASLDAHVAHHIVKHCILGILKDKTRIVVTRSVTLFYNANQILHVENGRVTQSDYMTESMDMSMEFSGDEADTEQSIRKCSTELDILQQSSDAKSIDSVNMEESCEFGNLSINVVLCYWKAIGSSIAFAVLLLVVLMQVSRNLSDAWLAHWVTDTTLNVTNATSNITMKTSPSTLLTTLPWNDTHTHSYTRKHSTGYYLGIFASLALTNSTLTMARAFLFAFAGLNAARVIHDRLLNKVMFAKFSFFDLTSVGRILNRFSSDTYTIDDSLPFILNILLAQMAGLAGALIVSLYAMPWISLVVIPIAPVYMNLQHRYRKASRDIKRLSCNALSPLYTHFTETLQGLLTIRTMRASIRFQRDFHAKLEESIKAQLTAAAAQQWLGLRLQLLGAILVGGAGLLAAITSAHTTNPGLVGLAISYALSITGLLGGLLNAIIETEQELIAVERVNQYLQLLGEENAEGSTDPPFGWPSQGCLSFKQVQMRYREHLPPALHDFTFKTEAFERIAIVGRTGAGKTSVLAALMRVAPLSGGEISLDGVNVLAMALRVLRDRISVIPQEPFLFEGTIRENLDPRKAHYDSEIWHAITNSSSATMLVQTLGGLDGHIDKGGINLSAGQKQLLCLARALLRNAKVVCIDEGTSSLDDESESAMLLVLRNAFKSSTVVYVAHRLNGLHRMDRVIVMEHGAIIEQGTPQELASKTDSVFHSMLQVQRVSMDHFLRKTNSGCGK